jgi:hypothetical protein
MSTTAHPTRTNLLPTVDFCGLEITKMIIGANPFGGFSHQNDERDRHMREYHTQERILETWDRATTAGINTMCTNNETPHIVEAVKTYFAAGGNLQWIAQVNAHDNPDMIDAVDKVVEMGCAALYFHGELMDEVARADEKEMFRGWVAHAKSKGVVTGSAGHAPATHWWINEMDVVDFHAVPFFDCGSIHEGLGDRFRLSDMAPAIEFIQKVSKPCIAYKILAAGRIEAKMGIEYALEQIKPNDIINVGMHRGDRDDMVEYNVDLVNAALGA